MGCDEPAEPPVEVERGLTLDDQGDTLVGTYADDRWTFSFRSDASDDGFDVAVVFNGMTITAQTDGSGVLTHDGYATDNGEPTQMTDDDREALTALTAALEATGPDAGEALARLRSFTNTWSEFPGTKDLHADVPTGFRAYTSICGSVNTFVEVTHDDWNYDRWEDRSTYFAYMSMHGAGPCSDGTWFSTGGAWQCYEPDHPTDVEYSYGNCFGRCGAGCGSGTQFTYDCADHDSCVRFGHSTASFWCNDEFSSTVDDWALAPNCL